MKMGVTAFVRVNCNYIQKYTICKWDIGIHNLLSKYFYLVFLQHMFMISETKQLMIPIKYKYFIYIL